MTPFSSDQWVMLLLVFLLGFFLGLYFSSGKKWKNRYREEVARREEIEREHRTLESTRLAADRHPVDRTRGPL